MKFKHKLFILKKLSQNDICTAYCCFNSDCLQYEYLYEMYYLYTVELFVVDIAILPSTGNIAQRNNEMHQQTSNMACITYIFYIHISVCCTSTCLGCNCACIFYQLVCNSGSLHLRHDLFSMAVDDYSKCILLF